MSAPADRVISVPLTPVIKGVSRSLAGVLRRWSGVVSDQTVQIPELRVRLQAAEGTDSGTAVRITARSRRTDLARRGGQTARKVSQHGCTSLPFAELHSKKVPKSAIVQSGVPMTFLSVAGGVIVVALVLAGWYDHRVKRRGGRVRIDSGDSDQRRFDVEYLKKPWPQGGQQNRKNWQERNR